MCSQLFDSSVRTKWFKNIGHLLHYAGFSWKNNRLPVYQILTGEYDLTEYMLQLGLTRYSSKIK